ncbi:hypothetical protein M5K25_016743 [Dendrobium thyrsiflorum]|uniref:Uncharacterized protein n=1 Tax=Dendrobium thyrsiflorum TaxID=117978 RepID=A0ABD0ULC6_DENTH
MSYLPLQLEGKSSKELSRSATGDAGDAQPRDGRKSARKGKGHLHNARAPVVPSDQNVVASDLQEGYVVDWSEVEQPPRSEREREVRWIASPPPFSPLNREGRAKTCARCATTCEIRQQRISSPLIISHVCPLAQDSILKVPFSGGLGEKHRLFVKWKYAEAKLSDLPFQHFYQGV